MILKPLINYPQISPSKLKVGDIFGWNNWNHKTRIAMVDCISNNKLWNIRYYVVSQAQQSAVLEKISNSGYQKFSDLKNIMILYNSNRSKNNYNSSWCPIYLII